MYNTLLRFFPFLKNKQADPLETLGGALVVYLSTLNKEEQDKLVTGLSMSSLKVSTLLKENNLKPVHALVPDRTYMIEPTLLTSPFSSAELVAQALLISVDADACKTEFAGGVTGGEDEQFQEIFEPAGVSGDSFLSDMGYSAAMLNDDLQEPELVDGDVGVEEDSFFDEDNTVEENCPFGLGTDGSEDETDDDEDSGSVSGDEKDFFTIGDSDGEDSVDTIVEKKGSV